MNTSLQRPELARGQSRVLAGVCSGLAAHLMIPVRWVRLGFALSTLLAGAGIILYGWLWIFLPSSTDVQREAERREGTRRFGLAEELHKSEEPQAATEESERHQSLMRQILVGAGLILVAGLFAAQLLGASLRIELLWPLLVVIAGAILAWLQLDDEGKAGLRRNTGSLSTGALIRLISGVVLVITGLLLFLSGVVGMRELLSGLAVALAVIAGLVLVLLPWALRFWRNYVSERTNRVRAAERADIAAHLHDSVLQTLALIQKRSTDPAQVLTLARAQERELRQWLYQQETPEEGEITEAIRKAAAEVEELYLVSINVVTVGECLGLPGHDALLQATREAMTNAAKHAGGTISVYVEATDDRVEIFVRDRGEGFDVGQVSDDRHGVRESIIGRMERNAGSAEIRSNEDGTEVHLTMTQEKKEEHA